MENNKTLKQIIGLGIIAGMRTTFAPALISYYLSKNPTRALKKSKLNFMLSPAAGIITKVMMAGEIVGDKSPLTPNRTGFPQILGRIASGGFAGAVIATAEKDSLIKGILIGSAAALAATFGAFYVRKYIDQLPGVKDFATGAAEDILAIAGGILLMK